MEVEGIAPLDGRLPDRQKRARVAVLGGEVSQRIELAGVGQAGCKIAAERECEVAIAGVVEPFGRLRRWVGLKARAISACDRPPMSGPGLMLVQGRSGRHG